jgi:hypothetical protein
LNAHRADVWSAGPGDAAPEVKPNSCRQWLPSAPKQAVQAALQGIAFLNDVVLTNQVSSTAWLQSGLSV